MTKFRLKITGKIKEEPAYKWAWDEPVKCRIGIAGDLEKGDVIQLEDGKQYFIVDLIRTGHEAEDVEAMEIVDRDGYIGPYKKLPPGSPYRKLVASTQA